MWIWSAYKPRKILLAGVLDSGLGGRGYWLEIFFAPQDVLFERPFKYLIQHDSQTTDGCCDVGAAFDYHLKQHDSQTSN